MNKILQIHEAQCAIKTGIWPGRFQFVHNGHAYVFSSILSRFNERIVAVVNPNPNISADINQPRFDKELNPLNYFQRMLTQLVEHSLIERILNLHSAISDFIKLHFTSVDETELNICTRFSKVPEQLMQIVKKIKYNVLSEQQAFNIFSSFKKQWEEK